MSQIVNIMSQQFAGRVLFLTEATSSLRRFGTTYALDGNRCNCNRQHYFLLEVKNKETEHKLCGIEPGKCEWNVDKHSIIWGVNTMYAGFEVRAVCKLVYMDKREAVE